MNIHSSFEALNRRWLEEAVERKVNYEATWLGVPIIQFPNDIVAVQEVLWRVKPDVVIETGVAHGGSLILTASILEVLCGGKVIGVDIDIRRHNRLTIEAHPLSHRIELVEGSSIDPATFDAICSEALAISNHLSRRVVVILDSAHTEAHVSQELELYAPLVTSGSYLICHDGAMAWLSDNDDNPLTAIKKFLAAHPEFEVDESCTRFGPTSSPSGYMRRK